MIYDVVECIELLLELLQFFLPLHIWPTSVLDPFSMTMYMLWPAGGVALMTSLIIKGGHDLELGWQADLV